MENLITYMTTTPSKFEKQVLAELKKITENMKANQKMIDSFAGGTSKFATFLFGNPDMELLDQMVSDQLARDNMYRDN